MENRISSAMTLRVREKDENRAIHALPYSSGDFRRKEFYIQQFKQQMPTIEHAFRWRLRTIPLGERIGSVTFMFGYLNALIGSLCLAGAVFIGTEQTERSRDYPRGGSGDRGCATKDHLVHSHIDKGRNSSCLLACECWPEQIVIPFQFQPLP